MADRCLVGGVFALVLVAGLALPAAASASASTTVPFDQRTWRMDPVAHPVPPATDAFAGPGREVAHAPDPGKDRFHLTAVRLWAYRQFLPKSKDADVLGVELNSAWSWGRVSFSNITYFEFADYARPIPGMPVGNESPGQGAATGISDILTAVLASPKRAHHGPHHWAAGIAAQFPSASDDTLGSGKWALGPAVEYEYEKGRFFAAFVALQLWSCAGDADRKNVNMLMIKPMVTYELARHFKAVYMPYGISVYWEKKSGENIYLPLGGGLQYDFRLWRQELAVSLQFHHYVLRPTKGTENEIRFMLELDF